MSSESFSNITSGIKDIFIILSIIAAGIWATYTFMAKKETESAKLNIEKLKIELKRRPVILGDISASYFNKEKILRVKVTLKNSGETDTYLDLSNRSMKVAKVHINKNNTENYDIVLESYSFSIANQDETKNSAIIKNIILLYGQEKTLNYLFNIKEIGVYHIQFNAGLSKDMESSRKETGLTSNTTYNNFELSEIINIK